VRQSFYIGIKAIIEQDGRVLLLKDSPRGKWELPGGRIDGTQTIKEAVSRELREEIIGAKLLKLHAIVHAATGDFTVENDHRLCLLFYAADVRLPEQLRLSDEHLEYAWVDQRSYQNYDLFTSDRAALTAYWTQGIKK
jgi:8-oxo-dGTP pyrophosphatase MutT (NUDIX family)